MDRESGLLIDAIIYLSYHIGTDMWEMLENKD